MEKAITEAKMEVESQQGSSGPRKQEEEGKAVKVII